MKDRIQYIDPFTRNQLSTSSEALVYDNKIVLFKKINGAYRVLQTETNYTESFGYQWNIFTNTQIDKESGISLSKDRFFAETGWGKQDLTNQNILEVGSGAGRFSQIVLDHTNANLYSVDYSNAVEANFKVNGHHGDRFKLFQASIYEMPFAPNQFDKVFCIGVLQHTPNFEKSIESLVSMVKPGGELVVDFYPIKGWWTKICAKYILRPVSKKMNHEKLLKLIDHNIDWLYKVYSFLDKIGLSFLTRFVPIVDVKGTLPQNLDYKELRQWMVLDTFDMFSPEHDHPQRISTVKKWFEKYGMKVTCAEFLNIANGSASVVRGIKPNSK